MKTLISSAVLALLIITSSSFSALIQQPQTAAAASFNCFDYVRVHRQGNGVTVSWAVTSPDVVQFNVERSYDGEFFEPVTSIPFAGSAADYKDMDIFPGTIYYRIVAVKSDGSTETSAAESVRIVKRG